MPRIAKSVFTQRGGGVVVDIIKACHALAMLPVQYAQPETIGNRSMTFFQRLIADRKRATAVTAPDTFRRQRSAGFGTRKHAFEQTLGPVDIHPDDPYILNPKRAHGKRSSGTDTPKWYPGRPLPW